jgi:hypothetical protein
MSEPNQTLQFLAWARPAAGRAVTGAYGGRARAAVPVTLTASGADGVAAVSQSHTVEFLVAGPADVLGLRPGAVTRRYPSPGAPDHETNRCPYVELADPDLPWRYTPAPTPGAASAALHPWLVLVVGIEGSELTLDGAQVTIDPSAQGDAHAIGAPGDPCRFAHVQQDAAGHRVARVLCGRTLDPATYYLAVLVPAYDAGGAPSWTGAAPATVPVYDLWRFRTAIPAGSFEDLAARLHPGTAPKGTGAATTRYERLPAADPLHVLGALVAPPPTGSSVAEAPLAADVAGDLAVVRAPLRDPEGRPVVGMPAYGAAWSTPDTDAAEGTAWGRALNEDPRHRGIAGLGLEVAIRNQEDLVDAVLAALGAVHEARQRVRHLALGVTASRSLWQRRVPAEAAPALWLVGPGLRRVATDTATLADLATAEDRTLPRGAFSAAARRVLRSGPARTAGTATTPAAVLDAANRPPPPPPTVISGVPFDSVALTRLDTARADVLHTGHVATAPLLAAATHLAAATDTRLQDGAGKIVTALQHAVGAHQSVPWTLALTTLAAGDAQVIAASRDPSGVAERLGHDFGGLQGGGFGQKADDADLTQLLAAVRPLQPDEPAQTPVALDALATAAVAAFDPTTPDASAIIRVLSTLLGAVDPAQPLAPPEPALELTRATWSDVADTFPDWLLPGVGKLDDNCVVAVVSNPIFLQAFLVGLNTGLLGELRWRNIPIASGSTLLRRFWDRADPASGLPAADLAGVDAFVADADLGDPRNLAPGTAASDLVIVVRGELLRRYPTTLVYLRTAVHPPASAPDFGQDPDDAAARVLPAFHGSLGADLSFFGFAGVASTDLAAQWLVFEEPPAGYRFANNMSTVASAGHDWAAATLADPVRVLIRGDTLVPGGTS